MKKMTKIEMFAQIRAHLTDESEIAFIDHEIELLENKKSGTRKPTPTQVANEHFKEVIVEILTESDTALEIKDIQAKHPQLELLTNQKMSALLTQLKTDGTVIRIVDGRKALFQIANKD
jgi:hypothetical protein